MKDLLENFSFDIQRFDTKTTLVSAISASSSNSTVLAAGYFWSESYALVTDGNTKTSLTGDFEKETANTSGGGDRFVITAGDSVTGIKLDSSATHRLVCDSTIEDVPITGLGNVSLSIIKAEEGKETETIISGLKFNNAGAGDSIFGYAESGSVSIALTTRNANLTLSKANTSIDATPVTLNVNGSDIVVQNTGYTYSVGKNNTYSLILDTVASANAGVVVLSGPSSVASKEEDSVSTTGYVLPKAAKTEQVLTIGGNENDDSGGGNAYKFIAASNSFAFKLNATGTVASGVNFGGTGDKLWLDEYGYSIITVAAEADSDSTDEDSEPVLPFTYGDYKTFKSGISIALGLDSDSAPTNQDAYLEMTGTTSFVLGGLTAGDGLILAYNGENDGEEETQETTDDESAETAFSDLEDLTVTSGVQFMEKPTDPKSGAQNATAGGSVTFDAKTAKLTSITALSGAAVQVVGSEKFTINGSAVDLKLAVNNNGTTTNLGGASLIVEYNYTDYEKPILDLSASDATEEGGASVSAITLTSAGGVSQVNIGLGLSTAKIGSTTFTLTQATSGSGDDTSAYKSAFVMNGNEASGFIFNAQGGSSGATTLTFAKGITSGFTFYYGDSDADSAVEGMPTITGTAAVAVGVEAKSATQYDSSLVVGKGAVLSFTDGTKLDFSHIGSNDYAKVTFDDDGVHRVTGYADTSNGGISAAVMALDSATYNASQFTNGSYIIVSGDKTEDADEGIIFGASSLDSKTDANYIATSKGNYTYFYAANDDIRITLADKDDTVYSTGGASIVSLQSGSGTVNYNEDANYAYTSGGKAYFAAGSGSLTGFVFMAANDKITLTDEAPSTFTLSYMPYGESAASSLSAPTVNDGDRTITMVHAATTATTPAQFVLSDIGEGVIATFGDNNDTYEFSATGGTVLFTPDGVTGFTAASGTVSLDSVAAGHLEQQTGESAFTINGQSVNIDAELADNGTLVYNKDDNSLLGLINGSEIFTSGDITKIYVTGQSAVYTFHSGDTTATDDSLDFTITSDGTDAEGTDAAPYFIISNNIPTEFHFAQDGDALTIPADFDVSKLKLYNGDDSFNAPIVTENDDDQTPVAFTITKTENDAGTVCFAITMDEDWADKKVTFTDGSTLTFDTVATADTVYVYFDEKTGLLLNVDGLTTEDDKVKIAGASSAVTIDDHLISIAGGAYTYFMDESAPSIIDLNKGATVVSADGIEKFLTAAGDSGLGTFTFGTGTASAVFTVDGTSKANGIQFDYADSVVSGIASVDNGESVTGIFFDTVATDFSFNDTVTTFIASNSKATYSFSENGLYGLLDGDNVSAAGGISTFITKEDGKFTFKGAGISIIGDDSVNFIVDSTGALSAIKGLDVAGSSAIGDFSNGLEVNGVGITVTGDKSVALYSHGDGKGLDEKGIAAIGGLSGAVNLKLDPDLTEGSIGADNNATITFSFEDEANEAAYLIAGNSAPDAEQTWLVSNDSGLLVKIAGVDTGESITGSFSYAAVDVDGLATVQVLNDDDLTVTKNSAGGLSIFNLSKDATITSATGTIIASTDSISGGEVFTFADGASVAISGTDKDGVQFTLVNGKLTKISGLSTTASVSGELNGIVIGDEPVISVIGSDGNPNTNLSYKAGLLAGINDGDTVFLADSVTTIQTAESGTFYFAKGGQSFTTTDDGLDFFVTASASGVSVNSISGLDAGETLSGNLNVLTAINGASVVVSGDDDFGVVGADKGISQIYNLSDKATVKYAGGAASALTDTVGTFYFGSQSFKTILDDEVTFLLNTVSGAVTGVADLSGYVGGKFDSLMTVNGEKFEIIGDKNGFFGIKGNDAENGIDVIGLIGGEDGDTVTIKSVGSATTLTTDATGTFVFTGGQSFKTNDNELLLMLDGTTVEGISALDAGKYVTGNFDGVSVNGAEFDISDSDSILTVYGKTDGISKIADVDGDATVDNAGGASIIETKSAGKFTFYDHDNPFTITGDNTVQFLMDTDEYALVKGISGINTPATIEGELGQVSVNGLSIAIEGDEDSLFSYKAGTAETVLGGINGDYVTINAVGGATKIEITSEGEYTFSTGDAYTLSGDNFIALGRYGVVEDLDGTFAGRFDGGMYTVNGKKLQVKGDTEIGVVGSGSAIAMITNLSDSSTIVAADGVTLATVDEDGTFTFAEEDGYRRTIGIEGGTSISFQLDGAGHLVSIIGADEFTTITGDLRNLDFTGGGSLISVVGASGPNTSLSYNDGVLSGVVSGDTVFAADGATLIVAASAESGVYVFGSGSKAQTFHLYEGEFADEGEVEFIVEGGNHVIGIDALGGGSKGALITGPLNGISINGGLGVSLSGDDDFGIAANEDDGILVISAAGSDAITLHSAGGAKMFLTDSDGVFTFGDGDDAQIFTLSGDNEVGFDLDDEGKVTGIAQLNGIVSGDFTGGLSVNMQSIQVAGDTEIGVIGSNSMQDPSAPMSVDAIVNLSNSATVVAWGSASAISTDEEGVFTIGEETFTVSGDSSVTFDMVAPEDEEGVNGVTSFENGTLGISAITVALEVNGKRLEFDTDTDMHLTIVDSKVVGVSGITGGISGLENATVAATGAITVNSEFVDITDSNDSFNVITAGGSVDKITDVTGDATVNVTNGDITADGDGTFLIGGQSWTFTDDNNDFGFTTNANQQFTGVTNLSGSVAFSAESAAFTVNGNNFSVASASTTAEHGVTVSTDGSVITAVEGLQNYDSVSGDLDDAAIPMLGSSASVKGEGSFLTVNGNEYQLLGDSSGVVLSGDHEIVGLDDAASLVVGEAGTYTVNGVSTDLGSLQAGDIIIGDEDPYIYDPKNVLVGENTTPKEIETMLDLPEFDEAETFGGDKYDTTTADPLDKDATDVLFDTVAPVDLDKPLEIFADNEGGKETQDLDLRNTDFAKKVHLYDGPQNVEFNNEYGNEVLIHSKATGEKNVTFGNGGNVGIIDAPAAVDNAVNITGGTGNDTLFVRGGVATNVQMGGESGGKDIIATYASANARVSLSGYDYASGAGIKIDDRKAKDIASAIADGYIRFGEGVVQIGDDENANSKISFNGKNDSVAGTLVNLYNPNGLKQIVGFTNSGGGSIDGSASLEDMILFANKDGTKLGGSTVTGGAGNDTAFAGAGDVIDLGAGENLASLQPDDDRNSATINISAGNTTIENMNNTLDEKHGDVLGVDLTKAEVKFDGTNLIVEGGTFYAVATSPDKHGALKYNSSSSSDLASSADTEVQNLVANGNYVDQIINSNGATWKGSFAADGAVIQVESDEDIRANYYKGEDAGVTFVGYTGNAIVDLANDGVWIADSSIDGKVAVFDGIVSMKAGAAGSRDMFKGSKKSETLMGGQGDASLYGDGGSNLLVGYNGTDGDKEGRTTFLVLGNAKGAANTITGFEFITDDNYTDTEKVTADILEVDLNTNHVERIDISDGTDVLIEVINNTTGVTEKALIEGAVGQDIYMNDVRTNSSVVAQVNTSELQFDKYATYYYATEKNATLTVDDANIQDNAIVWLGGERGSEYVGDFRVIDATEFSGKAQLAGNSEHNTVIAGSGEQSLWGGAKGDDVLIGGTGKNTFFYALGNGTDTVENAKDGDVVNLALALENISETSIDDTAITVKFTDGGSLTVNDGGAAVNFQVQGDNNSTYYADRDSGEWVKRA